MLRLSPSLRPIKEKLSGKQSNLAPAAAASFADSKPKRCENRRRNQGNYTTVRIYYCQSSGHAKWYAGNLIYKQQLEFQLKVQLVDRLHPHNHQSHNSARWNLLHEFTGQSARNNRLRCFRIRAAEAKQMVSTLTRREQVAKLAARSLMEVIWATATRAEPEAAMVGSATTADARDPTEVKRGRRRRRKGRRSDGVEEVIDVGLRRALTMVKTGEHHFCSHRVFGNLRS